MIKLFHDLFWDTRVASNDIPEGRRLNRRVELRVVTAETSLQASGQTVMAEAAVAADTRGLRPSEAAATLCGTCLGSNRRASSVETPAAGAA